MISLVNHRADTPHNADTIIALTSVMLIDSITDCWDQIYSLFFSTHTLESTVNISLLSVRTVWQLIDQWCYLLRALQIRSKWSRHWGSSLVFETELKFQYNSSLHLHLLIISFIHSLSVSLYFSSVIFNPLSRGLQMMRLVYGNEEGRRLAGNRTPL